MLIVLYFLEISLQAYLHTIRKRTSERSSVEGILNLFWVTFTLRPHNPYTIGI